MPPPLSAAALVVRAGSVRDAAAVLQKIQDAVLDGDGPVISVYCVEPTADVERDVVTACVDGDVPHGKVQVGVVALLLEAGLILEHDPSEGQGECHYNVIFGNDVKIEDAERFIRCFDEPIPNPTGGKKRRPS